MSIKLVIGVGAAFLLLVGTVFLVILMQTALSFCDWVEILIAADAALDDVQDFLASDLDTLIGDLPESAQPPARLVVEAGKLLVTALAFARDALLGPFMDALNAMGAVCATLS